MMWRKSRRLGNRRIPSAVIANLEETIEKNNEITEQIAELERQVEFEEGPAKTESGIKDRRVNVKQQVEQDRLKETDEVKLLKKNIQRLSDQYKTLALSHLFVPGKPEHKRSG